MVRQKISKLCRLKVGRYADHLIDFNEYLDVLPGAKASDWICVMELNEILLNSNPNILINQSHVQVFDF